MDDTDAQRQPYWAELEQIAKPARERRRLAPERRSNIIVSLCQRAPLSVKDLSILLDRSEAYIGDAIRPLVNAGRLSFLYPDQPRHPRQKYMAGSGVHIDLGPLEAMAGPDASEDITAPLTVRAESVDVTLPAPPLPQHAPRVAEDLEAPRFPNQATNLIYVVAVGVLLALLDPAIWWLVAAAAALALAWLHVARNSVQYLQFQALQDFLDRPRAFLVAKSAVAYVEIVIVFLVVRLLVAPA